MRELHDIHHKKGQGRARPNPLRNPPTHILGMGFGPRPAKLGGGRSASSSANDRHVRYSPNPWEPAHGVIGLEVMV